jgi:hypothetical protein
VQTYDIRDCEEYFGVLELEALLRKGGMEKTFTIQFDDIRRSSSKAYVFGASFKKSNSKQSKEGDSPVRKPLDDSDSLIISDIEDLLSDDSDTKNNTKMEINNLTRNETIQHDDSPRAGEKSSKKLLDNSKENGLRLSTSRVQNN